jgi:hypothetical protein
MAVRHEQRLEVVTLNVARAEKAADLIALAIQ